MDVPDALVEPVEHARRQPLGLYFIVLTEIWERFSFYGMRALLVLYLTQHFRLTAASAVELYGTYVGLLYLTPVLGGAVANRVLGFRFSVIVGAILMTAGHFTMGLEGAPEQTLFLALALIATGNGFFKPSLTTLLGSLYELKDPRRDSGFTWLVVGVNVGGAFAAGVCGYLGQTFGWKYGFGAAGVGMLFGLLTFLPTRKIIPEPSIQSTSRGTRWLAALVVPAIIVAMAQFMVQRHLALGGLLIAVYAAMTILIAAFALRSPDAAVTRRLLGLVVLTCITVLFWALLEQTASSMNLLTDRYVDRSLFGLQLRSSQFLALSPLFAIVLAPVVSKLWVTLARSGRDPGVFVKIGAGFILLSVCFGLLVAGIANTSAAVAIAAFWLMLAYLAHGAGELCISPISLSALTALSPPRMVGWMVGYWFLAVSLGGFLSGWVAKFGVAPISSEMNLPTFSIFFLWIAIVAFGAGALCVASAPLLRGVFPDFAPARSP
jgi:POT family proton-dependent oligopeptide transporter